MVSLTCPASSQPKAASVSKSMIHSFVRFAEPCIRVVVVLVLCSPTITLWKGTNGSSDSGRGPVPQPALRWLADTARNLNGDPGAPLRAKCVPQEEHSTPANSSGRRE